MVVSPKCAFRFEHKSSMPLVLYIPPPVPDFVFMKKGASQMSCAGAAAATATMPFFQKFNKGGAFFLPFFLLTGGSVYFCVLTPPLTPPSLPALWAFELERRLQLLSAHGRGEPLSSSSFQPSDTAPLQPSGPKLSPTTEPRHSWPLQTNSLTQTP